MSSHTGLRKLKKKEEEVETWNQAQLPGLSGLATGCCLKVGACHQHLVAVPCAKLNHMEFVIAVQNLSYAIRECCRSFVKTVADGEITLNNLQCV